MCARSTLAGQNTLHVFSYVIFLCCRSAQTVLNCLILPLLFYSDLSIPPPPRLFYFEVHVYKQKLTEVGRLLVHPKAVEDECGVSAQAGKIEAVSPRKKAPSRVLRSCHTKERELTIDLPSPHSRSPHSRPKRK